MNIPEGADCSQMPRFIGWGQIQHSASSFVMRHTFKVMRENYFTLCLGIRLFVAWMTHVDGTRTFRWWVH